MNLPFGAILIHIFGSSRRGHSNISSDNSSVLDININDCRLFLGSELCGLGVDDTNSCEKCCSWYRQCWACDGGLLAGSLPLQNIEIAKGVQIVQINELPLGIGDLAEVWDHHSVLTDS